MKKGFPILLSFLLNIFCFSLGAQVSFEAYADAKQVTLDGYFEVSFTLKNGEGSNFKAPNFKDFERLSGPNSSMSTQISNGRVTRQMGYTYMLQPKKVGKFTIGSASIKVNGKTLKTNSLSIEVVKGKTNTNVGAGNSGAEVFIRAEPNTTEARIGQQVLLDYKLYTTLNIENYSTLEESDYPGFFATTVKRYQSQVLREVIDGVQYTTKILKRVALFPQQTGVLKVEPIKMQLGVVTGTNNRSFFFRKNIRPLVVNTEAVEINVYPLPTPIPETFSGGVGKYSFQATIGNPVLTTDDALSVKMAITGNGDHKRLQAPALVLPEAFEVYDPKVLEEGTYENQGEITSKKILEYLVLPKQQGLYKIQPEFTYFDTDSAKFITLQSSLFQVQVQQGSNLPSNVNVSPSQQTSNEDIRFIKVKTKLHEKGNSFLGSFGFWVLILLPFLVLAGAIAWRQILIKKGSIDIGLLKRRHANKVAQKRLAKAKLHLEENSSRAYYDEVSRASLGYVCDKLQIPLSELTKDNVREKLQVLSVNASNIEDYMEIIKTCEMALFAGMDNSAAMQKIYDKAIAVIANIEEEIGK